MRESTLDPACAIPSDFVFGEVPSGVTFAARSGTAAPAAAAPVPVTAC
jgi:hypothetical protein